MAQIPGYFMEPNPPFSPDFPAYVLVDSLTTTQLQNIPTAIEKCIKLVKQLTAEEKQSVLSSLNPTQAHLPLTAILLGHGPRAPAVQATDEILEIIAKHLPAYMGRQAIQDEVFDRVYTTGDLIAFWQKVCSERNCYVGAYSLGDRPVLASPTIYIRGEYKVGVLKQDLIPRPKKDEAGNVIQAQVRVNRRRGCDVRARLSASRSGGLPQLKLVDIDGRAVSVDAVDYSNPTLGPRVHQDMMKDDWDRGERLETFSYNLTKIIEIARAEIYLHVESNAQRRAQYEKSDSRPVSLDPTVYLPTFRHATLISGRHIRVNGRTKAFRW